MPKNLTDVDEFTSPITVPVGTDLRRALSVEIPFQQLANRTENLKSGKVAGPATATDNAIARFDGTTGKLVQDSGAAIDDSNNLTTDGEYNYATAKSRTVVLPATAATFGAGASAAGGTAYSFAGGLVVAMKVDKGVAEFDLGPHLPSGCTLTRVRALVDPGAQRTGTDRMALRVSSTAYSFDAASLPSFTDLGGVAYDDGSLSHPRQAIEIASLSKVVDKSTETITALITAGSTASSATDNIYGLEVTFEDPGPRNF